MSIYTGNNYFCDNIKAVDARHEAQKIAFAPLTFQAVRALLDLGLLQIISESKENGISLSEAAAAAGISAYGAEVLLEVALGMNIIKLLPGKETPEEDNRFILGKIGFFLLDDEMTKVNFNFSNDVCYKGAFELTRSIKTGKPQGLDVFGYEGKTIYEVLSSLPERVKESWFAFDHFYSDISFEEALPIVFSHKPKKIVDIGGNTAKWAICCCKYDPSVKVLIADLPGQTAVAEKNAGIAGFSDRINVFPCNMLNDETALPTGADVYWMSQFLDCFSPEEITCIMKKVRASAGPDSNIYVLEPLWDKQRFEAASFSLQAISLYFTCMANGNSKMYRFNDLTNAIERAGFTLVETRHNHGSKDYSLLRYKIVPDDKNRETQ
ncbi:MAG: class I SAM-dependent methyltransferase [Treponema sp.]|nr:class I SAM-dependent methyltransferase [Treponema sp.]